MKFFSPKIYFALLSLSLLMLGCTMADNAIMQLLTKRFNKKCPIVTESLSIDGAEAISKDTIAIYISFISDMNDSQVHFQKQTLAATMTEPLAQMVNDKEYKLMKKKNVVFKFQFFTNQGIYLASIPITPEQYNNPSKGFISEQTGKVDFMAVLHHTAKNIKDQLPIESPDTGIISTDCYVEDSTLVTVNMIPNSFKEAVIDSIDFVSFNNIFYMEASQKEAVKNLTNKSLKVKYIYTVESGDTLTSLILTKENVNLDYSKLINIPTRKKYTIDVTIHNTSREIKSEMHKDDDIYYTKCYFENNVLTTELMVQESTLDNPDFDFDTLYFSILEASLNDELFTLFLIKQGVTLKYIYKDEDEEILETLMVTQDDISRYKKQKYDNNQILKY